MRISDLQNKKIAVWGLGKEGRDIINYLVSHNISNRIVIFNDEETTKPEGCEKFPLLSGNAIKQALSGIETIIRSPGVSIYREEFSIARQAGVAVTSVTDLCLNEFLARKNCKVIGISGSKGKSISVSSLAYILQHLGFRVGLGGNIGKPMIELLDGDYDFIVEEFSSYQASDLTASPHIAMFTNLFYVHTDWHHGHENYCRDKLHLIANQQTGDIFFINRKNEQLMDYSDAYAANRKFYNDGNNFYAEGQALYFRGQKLFSLSDIKLYGTHNLDNLAGVFSILHYLGLDLSQAVKILKDFETLPHRLQKVGDKNGVMFINDSISTAPEAAVGAVKSFSGNLALISGGQDTGQNYHQYAQTVEDNPQVKMVITLYQTGPQIAATLRKVVKRPDLSIIEQTTLEEAVKQAYGCLQELGGGTVLFSPTSPSFGYYKNFIERGNHFIKIVESL